MSSGPLPARTDRPREAAARVLSALVAQAGGPMTVSELTAVVGGHPNTVRLHLEHLEAESFVRGVARPAGGRGRPAQAYEPTVAGRQVTGQDERSSDLALLEALADHLAGTPEPSGAAADIGRAWGRRLGSQDLTGLLTRQGFTPVVEDAASTDAVSGVAEVGESERPGEGALRLLTCPLLEAAKSRPEIVCALHQGLVDATSPEPMRLVPFGAPDGCLLLPAGDHDLPSVVLDALL